jgi:hypothetical protein
MYLVIEQGSFKDFIIKLKNKKDQITKFRYVNKKDVSVTIKEFTRNKKIDFVMDFTEVFYNTNGGMKK